MSKKRRSVPKAKKSSPWKGLLKFIFIILFLIAALVAGAIAGYVVLGKQSLSDVTNIETWRHVFDLVFGP